MEEGPEIRKKSRSIFLWFQFIPRKPLFTRFLLLLPSWGTMSLSKRKALFNSISFFHFGVWVARWRVNSREASLIRRWQASSGNCLRAQLQPERYEMFQFCRCSGSFFSFLLLHKTHNKKNERNCCSSRCKKTLEQAM